MILWIAGWVILSISLVNYMNIYQVALLRRNRELGVKKVLGEGSPESLAGFWLENIIMVTGGVILAVVVIGGLAGWIEQEMGLPVRMDIRVRFVFVCWDLASGSGNRLFIFPVEIPETSACDGGENIGSV